jgi:hypothetical protein
LFGQALCEWGRYANQHGTAGLSLQTNTSSRGCGYADSRPYGENPGPCMPGRLPCTSMNLGGQSAWREVYANLRLLPVYASRTTGCQDSTHNIQTHDGSQPRRVAARYDKGHDTQRFSQDSWHSCRRGLQQPQRLNYTSKHTMLRQHQSALQRRQTPSSYNASNAGCPPREVAGEARHVLR